MGINPVFSKLMPLTVPNICAKVQGWINTTGCQYAIPASKKTKNQAVMSDMIEVSFLTTVSEYVYVCIRCLTTQRNYSSVVWESVRSGIKNA